MTPLPIDAVLPELTAELDHDGTTRPRSAVLVAPTGAGKTTRVPPAVRSLVPGRVLMTEPRRVVARAAARRIATETGTRVGDGVGYRVRFDSRVGADTSIVVMTEGVLVRRLQSDPFLDGVSAIVFDEFHERHVDTDLGVGLARQVQREVRPDLALVVMSATLEAERIAAWLGDVPVVSSLGRSYPVDISYQPVVDERPLQVQVASAVREAIGADDGNILVFLPGTGEIRRCERELSGFRGARVLTLHGRLSGDVQDDVIAPGGGRKVILATNIAESSLTVPGVTTVIDSGWARVLRYDPSAGLDRLVLERISKASADQRAGRAGRERPGRCVRLWPRAVDARMSDTLEPELHRADLAGVALQLGAWGTTAADFGWLDPPPAAHLESATNTLASLGCVVDGHVTPTGHAVAALPVAPRLGRMLLEGARRGVTPEAAAAAAVLAERDVVSRTNANDYDTYRTDSDLADRVSLVTGAQTAPGPLAARVLDGPLAGAQRIARQLERLARASAGSSADDPHDALLRAILAGFGDRVAVRRGPRSERATMVGGIGVTLGRHTALRDDIDLFVCIDVAPPGRGAGGDGEVRSASRVEREWLDPTGLDESIVVDFDDASERVTARRVVSYLGLTLDSRAAPIPDDADTGSILAEAAGGAPERAFTLDAPAFARLRARVAWLRSMDPGLDLPPIGDAAFAEHAEELCDGLRTFQQTRAIDLADWARRRFSFEQWRTVDQLAPESVPIPSGRDAKLRYEAGSPPVLAARIQELFGMHDTPRVFGGTEAVLVHLLAPNMRPQQITRDLRSFWGDGYAQVRRDLRARYPKHAWPEDPWTAQAERRPKRRR